jgi:hypothetical protein
VDGGSVSESQFRKQKNSLDKLTAFMRCYVILRHAASFCSKNDPLVLAGEDDGNTKVSKPASANAASSFREVSNISTINHSP